MNARIILGSNSPRRKELLSGMGYDISVYSIDIDESFPIDIDPFEVAEYVALKKAKHLQEHLEENEILICADTTVIIENRVLGKPINHEEAFAMIKELSGRKHHVVSGVAVFTLEDQISFSEITEVNFNTIPDEMIDYYIREFKPFDKAGSYGIQEWIGYNFISEIKGSYNNVVGLPTHRLFEILKEIE